MKNNENKKTFFSSKLFLLLLSFLVALGSWVAVVATVSTEQTTTIYNVPITLPASPSYKNYGIEIVGSTVASTTVNITVKGDRAVVSTLKRDSFTATPLFTNVTEAGTYELTLQITKNNPLLSFEITMVSPPRITLTFAEVESKTFNITPAADKISPADGYLLDTLSLSASEVTISGPKSELANIARVMAEVSAKDVAKTSFTETCKLTIYDSAGRELDKTNFSFSISSVDVTVPVYKRGALKLDIGFVNIPEGFNISTLNYKLSVEEINVAAVETIIDALTTRTVGYIDLTTIDLNKSYSFEVTLPAGVVNLDNITTITVTFPKDDLASKKVDIGDIRLENASGSFNYTIETIKINNVTVIAHTNDIDNILGSSAVAVADVSSLVLENGSYTVPVSIIIPGYPSAWAVGAYSVVIKVERK